MTVDLRKCFFKKVFALDFEKIKQDKRFYIVNLTTVWLCTHNTRHTSLASCDVPIKENYNYYNTICPGIIVNSKQQKRVILSVVFRLSFAEKN